MLDMRVRNFLCSITALLVIFTSCKEEQKDFSAAKTPGAKENLYEYKNFFLLEKDGLNQPYVGDTMPYYEDGVYYIYYLKDGGDSYNHSIYLATTKDFLTYEEYQEPILEASRGSEQDSWIGTGSVVKVGNKYYLFYTGHSTSLDTKEKIMVAEGDSLFSFTKKTGWEIDPPAELRQKTDFRDPEAYFDVESKKIILTVTASKNNIARILKFSLSLDLSDVSYDGIIFSDPTKKFWNLECSDAFKIGNKYYLTYSAQNDSLYYAVSDNPYGPYSSVKALDGKLFYAAKHVESEDGAYMVGWARRSESPSSTQEVSAWAGNLLVQKILQNENGELLLAPVDSIENQFDKKVKLLCKKNTKIEAGSLINYTEAFDCLESFKISGKFKAEGKGSFGLAFDYNGRTNKNKLISICPNEEKIELLFNEGSTLITETDLEILPNEEYAFSYIQEGSVGVFYVDGKKALTVRLYGVCGNKISLFAENCSVQFSSLSQFTR
jgi:sucrose-6-phosphate hydrolase SacC (GH32 family)